MPIKYRAELDRNLTALEADGNIRTLAELAATIQSKLLSSAALDGAKLVLTLADGTTLSVVLPTGGGSTGIGEAPTDGKSYARSASDWKAVDVVEAPKDGKLYGRKNAVWTEVPAASGGTPSTDYFRYRGDWAASMNLQINDIVEYNGMVWRARAAYPSGSHPSPAFANDGYWMPVSFPSGAVATEPLTDRIRHRFIASQAGGRSDIAGLSTILNTFETRIKALEPK